MSGNSQIQREALGRLAARFHSVMTQNGDEVVHVQTLAAILGELRGMPRDETSASAASAAIISSPIAALRFGAFPVDLDPRISEICAPYAVDLASEDNVEKLEGELQRAAAPIAAAEQARAATANQTEDEEARVAALGRYLDVLNAFVAVSTDSAQEDVNK